MDELTKKRVIKIMNDYINKKLPLQLQNQIKLNYMIRDHIIILIHERPVLKSEIWQQHEIAQIKLDKEGWVVYHKDNTGNWQQIKEIKPNSSFEKQLQIVDQDKNGLFTIKN